VSMNKIRQTVPALTRLTDVHVFTHTDQPIRKQEGSKRVSPSKYRDELLHGHSISLYIYSAYILLLLFSARRNVQIYDTNKISLP
jgi:hypothetical protein